MDIDVFRGAFSKIRSLGYVQSLRSGPTGVGYTLESLLGIEENNIALPDMGRIELKSHRSNSTSMITLFTFNRKAWKMNQLEAIKKFGTPDKNGRLGLYFTMSRIPNSSGLFLDIDEGIFAVRHTSGQILAQWNFNDLAERFQKKLPALILVTAQSEQRGNREWFHYTRARLLKSTSRAILYEQLLLGNILVDIRMHDKKTRARNHGTGFRTHLKSLSLLFKEVEDIE